MPSAENWYNIPKDENLWTCAEKSCFEEKNKNNTKKIALKIALKTDVSIKYCKYKRKIGTNIRNNVRNTFKEKVNKDLCINSVIFSDKQQKME